MLPEDPPGIPSCILSAPSAGGRDASSLPRPLGDLSEGPAYGGTNQKAPDPAEMPQTDAYRGVGTPARSWDP